MRNKAVGSERYLLGLGLAIAIVGIYGFSNALAWGTKTFLVGMATMLVAALATILRR